MTAAFEPEHVLSHAKTGELDYLTIFFSCSNLIAPHLQNIETSHIEAKVWSKLRQVKPRLVEPPPLLTSSKRADQNIFSNHFPSSFSDSPFQHHDRIKSRRRDKSVH